MARNRSNRRRQPLEAPISEKSADGASSSSDAGDQINSDESSGSQRSGAEEDRPPRGLPLVTWQPIRCPRCGSRQRQDRCRRRDEDLAYHLCMACGQAYKSLLTSAQ